MKGPKMTREQIETVLGNAEPIVLTDPPELVDLKREYLELCQREQELKPTSRAGQISATNATLLAAVRDRKLEIARQCYQLGLKRCQSLLTSAPTEKTSQSLLTSAATK